MVTSAVEQGLGVSDLMKSVWNQIRFGWNVSLSPRFTPGVPIHILGKKYVDFSGGMSLFIILNFAIR